MTDPRSQLTKIVLADAEATTEAERVLCAMFKRMVTPEAENQMTFITEREAND